MESRKTRGGARPGAGRKRQGDEARTVTVSFICTPSQKEMLKNLSLKSGLSQSQFICSRIFEGTEGAKIPLDAKKHP